MSGPTTSLAAYKLSKLEELKRLQAEHTRIQAERLKRLDVFGALEYEPTPRQQAFHDATEYDVFYGGALGGGKLLRTDEPIPVPSGWTTMGELRVGDVVFGRDGNPCTVTGAYGVDETSPAYRLTFDDGTFMDAGADHQWLTFTHAERTALTKRTPEYRKKRREGRPSRAQGLRSEAFTAGVTARNQASPPVTLEPPVGGVRTTKEIAGTLLSGKQINHAIPVAGALNLPEADLPVAPYVLGAWLGDGSSVGGGFTTADPEILDQLRNAGVTVTYKGTEDRPYAYLLGDRVFTARANGRDGWVNTFSATLRANDLERNKHIPAVYLRASVSQRLALLQGLMDTDGTCSKSGYPEFTTTSRALADGAFELVVSLGWKVRLRESRAKLNGKDHGPKWTLKWSADRPVFRLSRKAERQKLTGFNGTSAWRYIVGCQEILPSPMRCISVDAPDRLYLAGRQMVPTHNTLALLMEGIRACVRFPGIRVGAFRRTYPELKESLIKELAAHGFAQAVGAKWAGSDFELRFPNGSLFMFRYAENMMDASRRLGAEFQLMLFDERTQTPADVLTFLESRIRSGRDDIPVLGIRSASNPGGPSHSAAKSRYIEPTEYGQKVHLDRERNRTVRFIPSKLSDNPHLNEEYRRDLMGLPEQLRKAYLDGNWDVFEGQMFPELSYDRHVVDPLELPGSWRRYNGVDWGFAAPWAVLWAALDEDGRLWVYRELYEPGVGEADQARRILAAEEAGERITARYADDAMWAVLGDAKPIATVYEENGVHLERAGKGPGSRIAGWQRIHSYLAEAPACPLHRALGWDTCPRLHLFSPVMKLFKELADLPRARTGNPEDSDPKAMDHAADALRYLLVNIGNESQFHFPDPLPAVVTLDPRTAGPVAPYGYQTIGGFPVLGSAGSSPWDM